MKTLYVAEAGTVLHKADNRIEVTKGKIALASEPVTQLDSVVVMGNCQITAQALSSLAKNHVNIIHANSNGKIVAVTTTFQETRCDLRLMQYQAYSNPTIRLQLAKEICAKKIKSEYILLHNKRALGDDGKDVFSILLNDLERCITINEVLGVEGKAANLYFHRVAKISSFIFRSRRPAKDIFNALLNISYAMILSPICSCLLANGFDIQLGFLHSVKNGRPSLALDVLESFRAEADRFVTTITNRKEFSKRDFVIDKDSGGFTLESKAFKKYLEKFHNYFDLDSRIRLECADLKAALLEACTTDAHNNSPQIITAYQNGVTSNQTPNIYRKTQ